MSDFITYTHKSSLLDTIGEFVYQNGLSVAFLYNNKEKELLDYEGNLTRVETNWTKADETAFKNTTDYKAYPLRVGTVLKLKKTMLQTPTLSGISDGIIETSDFNGFLAEALKKIVIDANRKKLEDYTKKEGNLISEHPYVSVYIFCKGLFPFSEIDSDDITGRWINASKYVKNVSISKTGLGSSFSISLAPITAKSGNQDRDWNWEKDEEELGTLYTQNVSREDSSGLYNQYLFNNAISNNDLVFIKYSEDKFSDSFYLDGTQIVGDEYDMIGLVNNVTASKSASSQTSISVSGSDLLKILTEDACYFFPEEYAEGAFVNGGGAGAGNTSSRKFLQRVFGSFEVLGAFIERDLAYSVNFILNLMSYTGLLSDKVFEAWGERRNEHFVLDRGKEAQVRKKYKVRSDIYKEQINARIDRFYTDTNQLVATGAKKGRVNDKNAINPDVFKNSIKGVIKTKGLFLPSYKNENDASKLISISGKTVVGKTITKTLSATDPVAQVIGINANNIAEYPKRRAIFETNIQGQDVTVGTSSTLSNSGIKKAKKQVVAKLTDLAFYNGSKSLGNIIKSFEQFSDTKQEEVRNSNKGGLSSIGDFQASEKVMYASMIGHKYTAFDVSAFFGGIGKHFYAFNTLKKRIKVEISNTLPLTYIATQDPYNFSDESLSPTSIDTNSVLDKANGNLNDLKAITKKTVDDFKADIDALQRQSVALRKEIEDEVKTEAIVNELMSGVYQIFNVNIDESAEFRKIVDSSISVSQGTILAFFQKLADGVFVEMIGDTYGDEYFLTFRKPPFDRKGYEALLEPDKLITIEDDELVRTSLTYDTRSYSWYVIRPKGSFFGETDKVSLAFFPAIMFPKYVQVFGNKKKEVESNYIPYLPVNNGAEQELLKFNYMLRQNYQDLKFLIESNMYLPFTRKGTIEMIQNRKIKVGTMVFLKATGESFYVLGVNHSYSINGGSVEAKTTLTVERGMVMRNLSYYFEICDLPLVKAITKQPKITTTDTVSLSPKATQNKELIKKEQAEFDSAIKAGAKSLHPTLVIPENLKGLIAEDARDFKEFPSIGKKIVGVYDGNNVFKKYNSYNITKTKLDTTSTVTTTKKTIEPFPSDAKEILKDWSVNDHVFNSLLKRTQHAKQ